MDDSDNTIMDDSRPSRTRVVRITLPQPKPSGKPPLGIHNMESTVRQDSPALQRRLTGPHHPSFPRPSLPLPPLRGEVETALLGACSRDSWLRCLGGTRHGRSGVAAWAEQACTV